MKTRSDLFSLLPCKVGGMELCEDGRVADPVPYRFLAESIPQMVWSATPDGALDYVNSRGMQYFGATQDAALGAGWLVWVHPDDQSATIARWKESLETGHPYEAEFRLKRGSDGSWRLHLVRALPVRNADGTISQWFGTCTDVEDQAQSSRLVDADRQRWRELLLQAPAAVALLRGPGHRYEWANDDYARLVGRPLDAIVGKRVIEALPEVESQVYIGLLDNVYKTGEPFRSNEALVVLARNNGATEDVYINVVFLPMYSSEGSIDGVFVHAVEITEMVMSRKRVEESEAQLRTLAASIPNLAWIADASGNIFWYNQRWFDYTGATLQEMIDNGWERFHDPDVLPRVLVKWKTALDTGARFEEIFPLKGANGLFRTFLTRVEPIKDAQGNVLRWFGTNTDITEQIKVEEDLRRANADLQQFAFAAAHDLQEPLRMVTSYTQLLSRKLAGSLDESSVEYMRHVVDGSRRVSTLLHDLLAYAEASRGEEAEPSAVDLNLVLGEALANLQSALEESSAQVVSETLPKVRGNENHFLQLFQNLISNSIKYRSAATPEVRINFVPDAAGWQFRFRDNGIGIAKEYQEHVFGVFKRLHGKEIPGTGIGLAICQRVVERHGGRLWVESAGKGAGSTFCFTLRKDVP